MEPEKQPNAWYNNKFLLCWILIVIAMVCGTLYSVANILSATMEKASGPELKHPEVQEPQAKIDKNVSRAVVYLLKVFLRYKKVTFLSK
jgi:hypothetical protein